MHSQFIPQQISNFHPHHFISIREPTLIMSTKWPIKSGQIIENFPLLLYGLFTSQDRIFIQREMPASEKLLPVNTAGERSSARFLQRFKFSNISSAGNYRVCWKWKCCPRTKGKTHLTWILQSSNDLWWNCYFMAGKINDLRILMIYILDL